jgi:hypothetical protein
MRNVSATFKQALFAQSTDQVFLVLLHLSHTDLPSDIYLVNNREAITSNGQEYTPYAFGVDLPGDSEGRVTSANLVIDNTDRAIVQAVRSINDAPDVELSIVLASDPDEVELGPFAFKLRNVSYTVESVQGELFYQERLGKEIPRDRFIARNFPGMFI